MLQIPWDPFSQGFGKAAGYTKIGLENKNIAFLAEPAGYRGYCGRSPGQQREVEAEPVQARPQVCSSAQVGVAEVLGVAFGDS